MSDTNMDIRCNPDATGAILEFSLSKAELGIDLKLDEVGQVVIPVQLVALDGTKYTFRKVGQATPEGDFRDESVEEMRKRIGTVDDEEESMEDDED
jgi:hypothetical protein